MPFLDELTRTSTSSSFEFLRGNAEEVGELLKKGEAELGIAAGIGDEWDRLDIWPLFTEDFRFRRRAGTARRPRHARLRRPQRRAFAAAQLLRAADSAGPLLREHGVDGRSQPRGLVRARSDRADRSRLRHCGAAAQTASLPATLKRTRVDGLVLATHGFLYGVAGGNARRSRPPCADDARGGLAAILEHDRVSPWAERT